MAKPLIIDEQVKMEIKRVKEYAETDENHYTMDRMLDVLNSAVKTDGGTHYPLAPGNFPGFVCVIPMGFKVVYTIEHQNSGKMRHMSISSGPGVLPTHQAVEMVMHEFGFAAEDINNLYNVSIEPEVPGVSNGAVNIWEELP